MRWCHLALPPNVILELSNQRQNAHHQLAGARGGVDRGVVDDPERHTLMASSQMMR